MGVSSTRGFRVFVFGLMCLLTLASLAVSGFVVVKTVYDQAFLVSFVALLMFFLIFVVAFFNIIAGYYYVESHGYERKAQALSRFPKVALVVAAYNEEPGMVKETLLSLKEMDYPGEKISFHLLDDSNKAEIVRELEAFCRKEGVEYVHRENREWYKGGAINSFLERCQAEYLAVFDADEKLHDASFLKETLGFMEEDGNCAFVQTEKRFAKGSAFGNTVDALYRFYFKGVMPVKAKDGCALFSGSCGVLRISTLKKLGGMPKSVTEDTAYTLEAEAHGFGGGYVLKNYALGKPIDSFTGVSRQQWRYTFGNALLGRKYVENWGKLKGWRNYIHYFALMFGLQYMSFIFVGLAFLTLAIIFSDYREVLNILSKVVFGQEKVPGLSVEWPALISIFSTVVLIVMTSKVYVGDLWYGIHAFFLNFALSFVRIKATFQAFRNKYAPFRVAREGVSEGRDVVGVFQTTALECLFSLLFFIAGFVSVVKADFAGSFWLLWYGVVFSGAFYYLYRYH